MTRMRRLLRLPCALGALTSDRTGTAAIELAFTAPALLLFLIGITETGRMLWMQNALDYSVAEAARCQSNSSACATASQTQTYAANASGAGFTSSVFSVTTAGCGKQVSATYPMTLAIPYMNLSVTLTSQACYPT